MRYCSAGVLWRGRCVGMGDWRNVAQIWVYSWDIWSFSILEFWRIVFYLHGVWGCGGLCGGGMCYTWKPGDHIEYSGGARVANYTRVSILLHKIYMAVCKRVRKNTISQYSLSVSTANKVAKIQSTWLCGSHVEAEYTEQDRKLSKTLESKDLIEFFCPATEITLGVCSEMIELCRRQKKKVQGCMLFSKCWVKTFLPTDVEENVQ